MIPAAFVFLDTLPLAANGKVDRRTLPSPSTLRPHLAGPFVAPRDPVEAHLTKLWTEALSLEQIGVNDDFFDLGGNSIRRCKSSPASRKRCTAKRTLAVFFNAPTVAGLTAALSATAISPAPKVSAIQAVPKGPAAAAIALSGADLFPGSIGTGRRGLQHLPCLSHDRQAG